MVRGMGAAATAANESGKYWEADDHHACRQLGGAKYCQLEMVTLRAGEGAQTPRAQLMAGYR